MANKTNQEGLAGQRKGRLAASSEIRESTYLDPGLEFFGDLVLAVLLLGDVVPLVGENLLRQLLAIAEKEQSDLDSI